MLLDWDQPRRLIVKARQLGFSTVFAAEAIWKIAFRGPRHVLMLSATQDKAQDFVDYARQFLPAAGLVPIVDNSRELQFADGSRLLAEPATKRAGRSFAASDIYLDEFAHMEWQREVYRAVHPTITTGGNATIFSSPNGRGDRFSELWDGLLGLADFHRYHYDWRCLHDEAWAAKTRLEMTADDFAQEHGADFLQSGRMSFLQADIDVCFGPSCAGPLRGHTYAMTGDVAGEGHDAHSLGVWDMTEKPYERVAYFHSTEPSFELLYQQGQVLVERYRPTDIWLDATGLGMPIVRTAEQRWGQDIHPYIFTHASKDSAITALQLLTQQHAYRFDQAQLKRELQHYRREDSKLVTDCVMEASLFAQMVHEMPGKGVWL